MISLTQGRCPNLQLISTIHVFDIRRFVLAPTTISASLWWIADLLRTIGRITNVISRLKRASLKTSKNLKRISDLRKDIRLARH